MCSKLRVICFVAVTSCGRLNFVPADVADGGDAVGDQDAFGVVRWSDPMLVSGVSMAGISDQDCTLRGDMLELYFASSRAGDEHVFVTTRTDLISAWSTPTQVPGLNVPAEFDTTPEITYDGLAMWFSSTRQPASGTDLFASTRTTTASAWSSPAVDPQLSVVATFEYAAQPNPAKLRLVFSSDRSGNYDLYTSTRAATGDTWGAPVPIGELNTAMRETDPFLTADGLTLYYTSGATGNDEIVFATRASLSSAFGAPQPIVELSSTASEQDIWLSPDLRHAWFASDRTGDFEIYEVSR